MSYFTFTYPEEMGIDEAKAYVDRAKRKYGESNVQGVEINLEGNLVEIVATLKEGCRERIKRLSPAEVRALNRVKTIAEGDCGKA